MITFNSIDEALQEIAKGKIVIVVDDEHRENEGDFVMAAQAVTPEAINFMAQHGKGLICVPVTKERGQELDFYPITSKNTAHHGTAFTISIDATKDVTTGISAYDRAHTIQLITNSGTKPHDFVRPGHMFPLIAENSGVLVRPGHTEAAVDLARISGQHPSGVICEIMSDNGKMAQLPELYSLAKKFDLKIITIKDLIIYRQKKEQLIKKVSTINFATTYGEFLLHTFENSYDNHIAIALTKGNLDSVDPILTRVHSECITGDVLSSLRCDCGEQLSSSMKAIQQRQCGIIIYLKQEGRGIGLLNKIKAYHLQDQGHDTVQANVLLGLPVDMRDFAMSAQILKYFNVTSIKLLTNNPNKIDNLLQYGITTIERAPLETTVQKHNRAYLTAKKNKLGHLLSQL